MSQVRLPFGPLRRVEAGPAGAGGHAGTPSSRVPGNRRLHQSSPWLPRAGQSGTAAGPAPSNAASACARARPHAPLAGHQPAASAPAGRAAAAGTPASRRASASSLPTAPACTSTDTRSTVASARASLSPGDGRRHSQHPRLLGVAQAGVDLAGGRSGEVDLVAAAGWIRSGAAPKRVGAADVATAPRRDQFHRRHRGPPPFRR